MPFLTLQFISLTIFCTTPLKLYKCLPMWDWWRCPTLSLCPGAPSVGSDIGKIITARRKKNATFKTLSSALDLYFWLRKNKEEKNNRVRACYFPLYKRHLLAKKQRTAQNQRCIPLSLSYGWKVHKGHSASWRWKRRRGPEAFESSPVAPPAGENNCHNC